jgi:hypothetical protein
MVIRVRNRTPAADEGFQFQVQGLVHGSANVERGLNQNSRTALRIRRPVMSSPCRRARPNPIFAVAFRFAGAS